MRKIKFRAWDKKNKKWEDCFLSLDGKPLIDCQGGGLEDLENIILMQYIGRKDQNFKQIYECDILKEDGEIIGVVIYEENSCSFRIQPSLKNKDISFTESFLNHDRLEVAGNVFDNPKLIK